MKKIIDGKVYNTDTSKLIFEWTNGKQYGTFEYEEEALYCTQKGRYFLYYYGGALSRFAISNGRTSSDQAEIITVTEDEAKKWALNHMKADDYIKAFGEVEEA